MPIRFLVLWGRGSRVFLEGRVFGSANFIFMGVGIFPPFCLLVIFYDARQGRQIESETAAGTVFRNACRAWELLFQVAGLSLKGVLPE